LNNNQNFINRARARQSGWRAC